MSETSRQQWLNSLVVGDKVYFVAGGAGDRARSFEITVEKIGRKIIHATHGHKFDKQDGSELLDAGLTGSIFKSREDYTVYQGRNARWKEIHNRVSRFYTRPGHVGDAEMAQIEKILFPDEEIK